jgi:hypothetical protein
MTTNRNAILAAISAITLGCGCAMESGAGGDLLHPDGSLLQPTGVFVSSDSVNHGEQDGLGRLGTEILARTAEGTASDNSELSGLLLSGSALASMQAATGETLSQAALVGAIFRTVTPGGDPIELRIDALEIDPAGTDTTDSDPPEAPDATVYRYTISYSLGQEPGWMLACGVNEDGVPIRAIPLQHLWDYRQGLPGGGAKRDMPDWITFACEGFALAKCVDLGYKPWVSVDNISLDAHHQACTRMVRGDYCGDGRSQGLTQATVNVYDSLGIQTDPPDYWITESEWTAAGARCVRRSRTILAPVTGCTFELKPKQCGNPVHWDQTLLVSELP